MLKPWGCCLPVWHCWQQQGPCIVDGQVCQLCKVRSMGARAQVRAWAKEHNLGNPATGLWVWAQADEE